MSGAENHALLLGVEGWEQGGSSVAERAIFICLAASAEGNN